MNRERKQEWEKRKKKVKRTTGEEMKEKIIRKESKEGVSTII